MATYTDLQTNGAVNPFTKDISLVEDARSVKQSMINLIKTRPFERLFRSNIHSKVHQSLFENNSPIMEIELRDSIIDVISVYEPRVVLHDVQVDGLKREDGYTINIVYSLSKSPTAPVEIEFFLEKIR